MSPEPVSADEVLRAALDLIRPQAAAGSIEILEPASVERYVTADRQRLQQVLLNLLSNAVKYNRQGGAVRVGCEDGPSVPDQAALAVETHKHEAPDIRGTVLYIEDNLSNLRLLERITARRSGVTLLSAMQGSRGLELARDHRPHLIILDLHLPDMPGADVLARLRADPMTKAIPVVILSADATPGRMSSLLDQRARAYLTKPLDVRELLSLIDDTLRNEES